MSNLQNNIDNFLQNKNQDNKSDISFNKLIIPKSKDSMESFCLPKKFTFQPQQILLANILASKYCPWNINKNIRGILLYHQI